MNDEINKVVTTIPFEGFYNSTYDSCIEGCIYNELEFYESEFNLNENELETLQNGYWCKNTKEFLENFAKEYAESFICEVERETGIDLDANFESLESPKEYNFQNDRIFIEMPEKNATKFINYVLENHRKELEILIKQKFTSRDGFISHYKNDLKLWGNPTDWDHNQIGTCFKIFEHLENDIYDTYLLHEWLFNNIGSTLSDDARRIINKLHEVA